MKKSTAARKVAGLGCVAALFVASAVLPAGCTTRVGADNKGVLKVRVRYDDLNLGTEAGDRTLKRRVRWAAEQVCDNFVSGDFQRSTKYRNCVTEASNQALGSVRLASR
jgi:UrcA family protein